MKILITGSSGHLGEALVRTLRKSEHKCIGTDLLPSPFTDQVGRLEDRAFVAQCMEDIDAVIHTATLHKPHIVTHSNQDFVDTNITGTLNLLEEAKRAGVQTFLFTSTTSTFGDAMRAAEGQPAIWVSEELYPSSKNIYGVTKLAAEDLCKLFHRQHGLPCLVLRTSRFFAEADDNKQTRQDYEDANVKVNEFLYRRVDIADIVDAHLLALARAPQIGFAKYIISATTPFTPADLAELGTDAPAVLKRIFPDYEAIYKQRGWRMFPTIDRVYVNKKARAELGWQPKYDFRHILDSLKAGKDYRSPLAIAIGTKGYHDQEFEEGPYPV